VTQYRLLFEGTNVARIKPVDGPSTAPLAWFRVVYADAANDVIAVHIYGHARAVSDRPWLASCATVKAAVKYCYQLPTGSQDGSYNWAGGSIETNDND